MKTTKIKKVYKFELEALYRKQFKLEHGSTLDYRLRGFFEKIKLQSTNSESLNIVNTNPGTPRKEA